MTRRDRRVQRISFGLWLCCVVYGALVWPPVWQLAGGLLLSVVLGAVAGAALDCLEDRRARELAKLRRQAIFGRRPLTEKEGRRLLKLAVSVRGAIDPLGLVLIAGARNRRQAEELGEALAVAFDSPRITDPTGGSAA